MTRSSRSSGWSLSSPSRLASRLAGAWALAALMRAAAGCVHTHAPPPPPAVVAPNKPDYEHGAETGIPVASTPQGLMQEGAERKLQSSLRAKGFLRAEQCTGQLDADTREALRRFQKREGLPATGLPSYETVRHLDLDLDSIFHTVERGG